MCFPIVREKAESVFILRVVSSGVQARVKGPCKSFRQLNVLGLVRLALGRQDLFLLEKVSIET